MTSWSKNLIKNRFQQPFSWAVKNIVQKSGIAFKSSVTLAHIRRLLRVREVASSNPVSSNALVKFCVLEIPLDKELNAKCLVEIRVDLQSRGRSALKITCVWYLVCRLELTFPYLFLPKLP